ncbi:MAG: cytochrome c [Acidobacteriota bacterium]|nr:cytochrome c [Acidobacteriota bacterium]
MVPIAGCAKRRSLMLLAAIGAVMAAMASSRGSLLQRVPAAAGDCRNPYEGNTDASAAGAKLYRRECASCHGDSGEGIGHAPPLASIMVRKSSAGALFWVLRNGGVFHGMPSFSHLPPRQRWQIVTYLQSR